MYRVKFLIQSHIDFCFGHDESKDRNCSAKHNYLQERSSQPSCRRTPVRDSLAAVINSSGSGSAPDATELLTQTSQLCNPLSGCIRATELLWSLKSRWARATLRLAQPASGSSLTGECGYLGRRQKDLTTPHWFESPYNVSQPCISFVQLRPRDSVTW
jgi:hypothetical protein